ncbi:MAG: type ISP restriction/modification enzyme [Pirellulaceae bacterium]|nr:type ISP restriction/modification enzyme [Pirellulaceae bacterium]
MHALDDSARRRRGVYFTPQPLVEFVVNRAVALAAKHFASEQAIMIDPACGYGAFLLTASRQWPEARRLGCEICPITWGVANLLLANEGGCDVRLVNPLLAGGDLRDAILGPPGKPLVPVIVGNPPWSNFGRQNGGAWIGRLLADYRRGLAERKSNLADDFIKFVRWGQHWIDQAGRGILAFVTPNTWLDGLTHRQMRASLLATFDDFFMLDLHGEADRADDENVFGVRSGVAVTLLVKHGCAARQTTGRQVTRYDLTGSRAGKLAAVEHLPDIAEWLPLRPVAPDWSLAIPTARRGNQGDREYDRFWPLDRIFRQYISGVQTKNDSVFVGFSREELTNQVQRWLAERARAAEFDAGHIQPYLVAPFDRRWVYYDPRLIGRARLPVMRHFLRPNLGLVFMRQATGSGEYDHFLAVDALASDRVFYSRRGAPFVAPLWLADHGDANFTAEFVATSEKGIRRTCGPRPLFAYLYALGWCGEFRHRFADELRRGFPRLPVPTSAGAFEELAKLGEELIRWHIEGTHGDIAIAETPIDKELRVGGYAVIERWQKVRAGRSQTTDDEQWLAALRVIARETARLKELIDTAWNQNFRALSRGRLQRRRSPR